MALKGVQKAVGLADKEGAHLGSAVVTTRDKLKTTKKPEEKRTKPAHTYLAQAEYDGFIELIGRKTVSDALRDLVLEFIKQNAK